jgi:hypothetical protein
VNKEQSRQRWRELRDLVNTWDPIGLIAIGAPQDEYECVVAPVLRLLEQGASQEAIVSYLAGECSDHFGAPIAESSAREFAARAKTWYQLRWHTPGTTGDESEGMRPTSTLAQATVEVTLLAHARRGPGSG